MSNLPESLATASTTGERKAGPCKCGMREIPAHADVVKWYWQEHGRERCSVDLPNERCDCGLLLSEHITGHAEPATAPAGDTAVGS